MTDALEQHYNQHRSPDTCSRCRDHFEQVYPRAADHGGATAVLVGVITALCAMIVAGWQVFGTALG